MSSTVHVLSIAIFDDLYAVYVRLPAQVSEISQAVHQKTLRVLEALEQRQRFWMREVELRRLSLDAAIRVHHACVSSRSRCTDTAEAVRRCRAALQEAEENLAIVTRCLGEVRSAFETFIRSDQQVRRFLDSAAPHAQAVLRGKSAALLAYMNTITPITTPPSLDATASAATNAIPPEVK